MADLYIKQQALEEYLERNSKSLKETIEKYKDGPQKIGTVADGGQIGMMMAYEGMLQFVRCSDIFKPQTVSVEDNENTRIDYANQLKCFAGDVCESFEDRRLIENFINKWLETVNGVKSNKDKNDQDFIKNLIRSCEAEGQYSVYYQEDDSSDYYE